MKPITREDLSEAIQKRCNINFHDRFDILGAMADECNDLMTKAREEKIGNEIEYKVIDTRNVGVPLVGDDSKDYDGNFARGLTEKYGKDGWLLCGVAGGNTYIFARRKSTLDEPKPNPDKERNVLVDNEDPQQKD